MNIAFWDRLGIGISGLCAVHCLFFPIAIVLLPLWPGIESVHDWTHPVLLALIVPTVVFALQNRRLTGLISRYLFGGLLLVGTAWMLHEIVLSDWAEATVTLAGSGLLVRGHWLNYKFHKIKEGKVA